jgi:hypothetical protein
MTTIRIEKYGVNDGYENVYLMDPDKGKVMSRAAQLAVEGYLPRNEREPTMLKNQRWIWYLYRKQKPTNER